MQLTKSSVNSFVAPVTSSGLKFDYEAIEPEHRKQTMAAAVVINAEAGKVTQSFLTIGRCLSEVKKVLEYGTFEDWVHTEFSFTMRTAQNFMRGYKEFGHQPKLLNLFSPTGLLLLTSAPEEVKKEIITEAKVKAKVGEKLTTTEIKERIKSSKKGDDLHERNEIISPVLPTEIDAEFTVVSQMETRTHTQWWNELSATDKDARIKTLWESEGKP